MTRVTVWHDGACPLCQREIALMRRLDRRDRIEFIDVSDGEASACPIDRSELLARFHAREGDKLLSGAAAFAALASASATGSPDLVTLNASSSSAPHPQQRRLFGLRISSEPHSGHGRSAIGGWLTAKSQSG